jgi:DNA-binding transcriptional MerR regulator
MNGGSSPGLSLDELAQRVGVAPTELRHWRSLRLIGSSDRETFDAGDLEAALLIRFCLNRGVALDTILRAEETESGFLRHYLDQIFPEEMESTWSPAEAAGLIGLNIELIRRLREIAGSATLSDRLDEQDVQNLRGWKVALDAGLPEEALLQLVRVRSLSMRMRQLVSEFSVSPPC